MRPAALAGMLNAGLPLDLALENSKVDKDQVLDFAIRIGAPLVPALNLLEQQLAIQEKLATEISQAQAVPRATRKLLLWLPAASVLLGEFMGLGTIRGLLSPLGALALLLAVFMLWAGHKITGRMLNRMTQPDLTLSDQLMALSLCLSAGLGWREIQLELGPVRQPQIDGLVNLSKQTGASLRPLIAAELDRIAQEQLNQKLAEAKKLSVSLLIPLSLTTLPAFLLLTIPPMVIGITQ